MSCYGHPNFDSRNEWEYDRRPLLERTSTHLNWNFSSRPLTLIMWLLLSSSRVESNWAILPLWYYCLVMTPSPFENPCHLKQGTGCFSESHGLLSLAFWNCRQAYKIRRLQYRSLHLWTFLICRDDIFIAESTTASKLLEKLIVEGWHGQETIGWDNAWKFQRRLNKRRCRRISDPAH